MKIITIIQTKGGSGKTTLAMILATAALARGQKVQMFDGDINRQLLSWPIAFDEADWGHVQKPDWPENLKIAEPPTDVETLYEQLDALENGGTDLVIFDTRPGSYETTEDYAMAADMVLIPAKPAQSEWRLVLSAFEWMIELQKTVEEGTAFPLVKSVIANVPTKIIQAAAGMTDMSALPKRDQEVLQTILETPHLDTLIPNSRIFEQMLVHGPLNIAAEAYRGSKSGAMARNFEDLTGFCTSLYDEFMEAVE